MVRDQNSVHGCKSFFVFLCIYLRTLGSALGGCSAANRYDNDPFALHYPEKARASKFFWGIELGTVEHRRAHFNDYTNEQKETNFLAGSTGFFSILNATS